MRADIDGAEIQSEADLHWILKEKLDFGPYYGANLDALWDRLTTDVERPVHITWKRSELSRAALGDARFEKIRDHLLEVQERDRSIEWLDRLTVTFE